MGDVMRWRHGETCPVLAAVDAATVIEIGDLLYLDGDDVKPASAVAGIGSTGPANLAAAQEFLHDRFLGVAMQRSRAGETEEVRVATAGVFEMSCAAGTFELGDRLGGAAVGTALSGQRVVGVAANAPQLAIGRAAKRAQGATSVLVELSSTVMRDGPQAVA